jgi:HK97 gp10 family phage protein
MAVERVKGLDDLKRKFREIPRVLRTRLLRNWLAAGARLVRDEAKRLAPVLKKPARYRKPGTVRDAIRVRTSKAARRAGDVGVFVNVKPVATGKTAEGVKRRGAKSAIDPFYWRWLEFGRAARRATGSRSRVARVKVGNVEVLKGVRFRRALRAVSSLPALKFLTRSAGKLPDALRLFETRAAAWFAKTNTGKIPPT